MPSLETPRLVLRAFVPSIPVAGDAMLSDPETTRYMHVKTWAAARRREKTVDGPDFEGRGRAATTTPSRERNVKPVDGQIYARRG